MEKILVENGEVRSLKDYELLGHHFVVDSVGYFVPLDRGFIINDSIK